MMVGPTTTSRATSATNTWTFGPSRRRYRFNWIHVEYTSDATAGNRQLLIQVKNAAGDVVIDVHAGAVQAASNTYHYSFMPGIYRETAFVSNSIQVPIPMNSIMDANFTVVVYDSANVSASDTMVIGYQIEEI